MKPGDILSGKYKVERLLGKGGSGAVYLCINTEIGNKWAVKHIPKDKINDRTMSEIDILKRLYHISLPRIADIFRNEQGLFIVESNIEGINLDRLLKQHGGFEPDKVVDWFLELCDILLYLHGIRAKPIVYGDMKPSNIILTSNGRLALVDFGISRELCECQQEDSFLAGTNAYAAPEQLVKGGRIDCRTDIYNLGATMYQLLHGRLPKGVDYKAAKGKDKAIARVDDIIVKCMENSPEDRYQKVENIIEELGTVKNLLVLEQTRQKLVFKLETALIVVLSAVSYAIALLGILESRP